MTKNDKQIIESFLKAPPVKAEPDPAAARYRVRRATVLTQGCLYYPRSALGVSQPGGIS
jgi:hypothetical protein